MAYGDMEIRDGAGGLGGLARVEGRKITLRPVRIETEGQKQDLDSVREKVRRLGVTENDLRAAIRWARKEG